MIAGFDGEPVAWDRHRAERRADRLLGFSGFSTLRFLLLFLALYGPSILAFRGKGVLVPVVAKAPGARNMRAASTAMRNL